MSTFAPRFKEIVDRRCIERSTTVVQMADDLEIGRTRFRHYWERGSRPDHDLMLKIAEYLEVDLNWLFGRDVSPDWPKADPLEQVRLELDELRSKTNSS